jgi:hypothetical protein
VNLSELSKTFQGEEKRTPKSDSAMTDSTVPKSRSGKSAARRGIAFRTVAGNLPQGPFMVRISRVEQRYRTNYRVISTAAEIDVVPRLLDKGSFPGRGSAVGNKLEKVSGLTAQFLAQRIQR